VFILCPYAYNQKPKDTTKTGLYEQGNTGSTQVIDSLRYIPQPIGWTNDFVDLFSTKERESLDSLIIGFEKKTSVEFAVAAINSDMMGPIDFEPYTLLMMNTWGVGKKGKNNGILIVIASDLRQIRIQNGYGIEKVLTNEETKEIIDTVFVPYFKIGQFYEGTKKGILALMNKLEYKDSNHSIMN
jgi:uncharacterized protein